jgi:hypothetical protein
VDHVAQLQNSIAGTCCVPAPPQHVTQLDQPSVSTTGDEGGTETERNVCKTDSFESVGLELQEPSNGVRREARCALGAWMHSGRPGFEAMAR